MYFKEAVVVKTLFCIKFKVYSDSNGFHCNSNFYLLNIIGAVTEYGAVPTLTVLKHLIYFA